MRTRSLVKIQIGEGPEGKLVRTEVSRLGVWVVTVTLQSRDLYVPHEVEFILK
jgi:hypothetical protein